MGWRSAFNTVPTNNHNHNHNHDCGGGGDSGVDVVKKSSDPPPMVASSRSPRFGGRLNFFTSSSNPSTPKLRCRTDNHSSDTDSKTPKIDNKPLKSPKSSRFGTEPSSPKSPLKLALFRNSFRARKCCGVCGQSVKSGRGTAVYTAQCGHVFHFPCIATHVRGTAGKKLTCLVCSVEWSDEPLLTVHQNLPSQSQCTKTDKYDVVEVEEKRVITKPNPPLSSSSSPRTTTAQFHHYQNRPMKIACYDDDEPLNSPRAPKPVFSPIPESEYEGEETSMMTKVRTTTAESSSANFEIRLMPESALVSTNYEYQTCAMVLKVKAPQTPQTAARNNNNSRRVPLLDACRRAPIDLVMVLDVSGSMMGEKLQMMRRAMRLVISSLGPQDRLSIVAFSAVPKRLFPFRRMTQGGQRAARSIVDRLECSQGSCVGDALRKATKVLEDRRERNPVATIILLSDGQDDSTKGQRSSSPAPPQSSHNSTTRFAHVELPVDSPTDDTFAKWVGGLLSVVAQDVRIELGYAHGSPPVEIMAVYCSDKQKSLLRSSNVALGDLYAEEERELLVELRVPISFVSLEKILTVKCSYKNPPTHRRISCKQETFIIPQPSLSPGLQRLRNVFISTRSVAESRQIVEHGEFTSAHRLLSSARTLLMQSGSMSADECIQVVEAEIMELARRRQEQQNEERERVLAGIMQRKQIAAESLIPRVTTPPSSGGKKKSWNRVSDLHGLENARF